MTNTEIFKRAYAAWGTAAQMDIAIEEFAEIIAAIQHFRRGKADRLAVLSEVADVEIMCEQLRLIFADKGEVAAIKSAKIAKLAQRLPIVVREAIDADADQVASVCISATNTLRQTYRPTQSLIEQSAATLPPQQRLVAIFNEVIRGTLRFYESADTLHLIGLGVQEGFRGFGIGRALIEHAASVACTLGKTKISCRTIKETGNIPFFASCGFAVIQEVLTQDFAPDCGDALTDVLLERDLR